MGVRISPSVRTLTLLTLLTCVVLVVASPVRANDPFEPNDLISQAVPIKDGQLTRGFLPAPTSLPGALPDIDYFSFTLDQRQQPVHVIFDFWPGETPGTACNTAEPLCQAFVQINTLNGENITAISPAGSDPRAPDGRYRDRIDFTVANEGTYLLRIAAVRDDILDSVPLGYEFTFTRDPGVPIPRVVTPSAPVTTRDPPKRLSAACSRAQTLLRREARRLRSAKRAYRRSPTRARKRKKQAAQRRYRAAQRRATRAC